MKEINYFGELLFLGLNFPELALLVFVTLIIIVFICVLVIKMLKKINNKRAAADIGEHEEPKKDYYYDRLDDIFVSHIDKCFKVRVSYQSLRKQEEKDGMIISSSYPHKINPSMLKDFCSSYLPQVQMANVLDSHRLYLVKSPAASFFDYQTLVLDFMFDELHSIYCFDKIKQEIEVVDVPNKDILLFKTKLDLHSHEILKNELMLSYSTSGVIWNAGDTRCFEFMLKKEEEISWLELRPKIMKIIERYFSAGVIWKGEWGKKSKIEIIVKKHENPNILSFSLPEGFETKNHNLLGAYLMGLCGIVGGDTRKGLPLNMDVSGPELFLEKVTGRIWTELKPRIRRVFEDHFASEVIWRGEWGEKASFSIQIMEELFNKNMMRFVLPEEFNTKNHKQLEIKLMRIYGVVGGNKNTGMLADMDTDGPVFFLRKEDKASWEEIIAEAKIIMSNYFQADINWEILINKKDLGK